MEKSFHTKLLIIGAGPAGYTAAIYGARANLQPIIVAGTQPGGQLMITTDVENYPGFAEAIQGPWLMEQMRAQAEHVGAQVFYETIEKVDFSQRPFRAWGDDGTLYSADAVVVATGAQAKWLGLESEIFYRGFGVSACATCDGFFFKNKKVAVIGGGNTAVEEALYLTHHAAEVILIHRRNTLRAEKILQERLKANPKITVLWNRAVKEILGETDPKRVTGVQLIIPHEGPSASSAGGEHIAVDGVFVAIGHAPMTEVFKGILELDAEGYLKTGKVLETSVPGVFAAGDVQDKIYRQAVTAAGQGCMAALDAERFLTLYPSS